MAQDATGTPTAKGIPKFNTAVDAPSGKGFNAGMDAIDTLLDSYAAKPSGIVSGEVPVWNGSAWVRSSVTRIGVGSLGSGSPSSSNFLRGDGTWASAGAPTYQTTLPGSPVDGQQTIFVDSTSAPTYAWYLRYNSTLAKWQYIGGLPKVARVNTYESTTSTTYANLTTDGPTFAVVLVAGRAGEIKRVVVGWAGMSQEASTELLHRHSRVHGAGAGLGGWAGAYAP